MKKKYGDMVKLCYMDTDSLIMNIKTKEFYKHIAQDVEESLALQIMMLIDHYLKEKTRK